MLPKSIILMMIVLVCVQSFSQMKVLQAVRVMQAPTIDGSLDDSAWVRAPVVSEFIQNFPTYGFPSSRPTKVKIVYDNTAIYIGAYLYDDSSLIRKQLTARDGELKTDVDYFSIFFDTYNDHQNGFQFLVTTANVQSDARLSPNAVVTFGDYGDKTWDAVWMSEVSMKADGWVVEMKIPYTALRFSKKEIQNWGLQFLRFTRRNNETCFWNPVNPNINGFVNQFGNFEGLEDIQPPLRLSFSPYISSGIRATPETDGNKTDWLHNGGMDVKYGINESFTLDATLIPDFGQVVSDNVINNLTPYEVRFTENRPFFTEGTELFNKAGLFYSRRVGAVPTGFYDVREKVSSDPNLELIKNPGLVQLYNAIKFSGRTKKKLGIGIFNAVTAPMYAMVRDKTTDERIQYETEPLTNYNIIVLDQALKGRSYITFTNTNVIRDGNSRDANVSAFDFALYDKSNLHSLSGTARYSKIFFGSDPYDGFNTALRFKKVSGKIQYGVTTSIESDQYDPNDLGFLTAANDVNYIANLSYNQLTPTKNFLSYNYGISANYNWLYKPYAFSNIYLQANATWVFRNFWDVTFHFEEWPSWQHDYFELRTAGRFLKRPLFYYTSLSGSTDSRKKFFFRYSLGYSKSALPHSPYLNYTIGGRYRFSNKFSLDLNVDQQYDEAQFGYAGVREPNLDPIVGIRRYKDVATVLSGIYNFGSRTNLTFRARHYWSEVHYKQFFNVSQDGSTVDRSFIAGQDQNVNIFNLDAFFTWDFRLGSRIILGWKNDLGGEEAVDGTRYRSYLTNFGQTFALNHGNELTVRFIYYFDYNQLRRNK